MWFAVKTLTEIQIANWDFWERSRFNCNFKVGFIQNSHWDLDSTVISRWDWSRTLTEIDIQLWFQGEIDSELSLRLRFNCDFKVRLIWNSHSDWDSTMISRWDLFGTLTEIEIQPWFQGEIDSELSLRLRYQDEIESKPDEVAKILTVEWVWKSRWGRGGEEEE